jgi:hypothetical protein
MAYPSTAVKFADAMDSKEVLEWIIPMASVLQDDETIDPDPDRWSLVLLAEAAALGFEIIADDPDYPDPALVEGDVRFRDLTAIKFWTRVADEFQGTFLIGAAMPMEATAWTTSVPPRRRQRTAVITVVEQ